MTLRHSISLLFLSGAFASGAANPVFAVAAGLAEAAEAAKLDYHHQSWTPDDGLPDNAVNCLLQTRDGWLWIGTRSGLARFDGIKFTVFHGRTPGFTDDSILALAEDLSGNLWIATKKGLYRKQGGVFTKYTTAEGLVHDHVAGLHLAQDGSLWVATQGGLNRLKDGVLTGWPLTDTVDNHDGQSKIYHEVLTVTDNAEGSLWVGTIWGLEQFDTVASRFRPVWTSPVLRSGTFQAPVQVVFADRDGRLWFGTDDMLVRREGDAWREYRFEADGGDIRLRRIVQAADGTIWVVRAGKLFRVRGDTLVREDDRLGLADSYVTDVLFTGEGIVWVGTRYRGLQCLRPAALRVFTTRDGLCHNGVVSVSPSRDGGLWVGTQRGLMRLHNGTLAYPQANVSARDLACRVVFEESNGDLWLGTAPDLRGSIHCLEKGSAGYRLLRAPNTAQEQSALFEDGNRRLWIGGRTDFACLLPDDLAKLQGREDPNNPGETLHRENRWVFEPTRVVSRTRTFPVMFATNHWRNLGDQATDWMPLSTAPAEYLDGSPIRLDQRLSSYDVRAILEDRHGDIWFGTWGGGLNRLRDRRIEVFTARDGLAGDRIQALHQDAEGVLWIGTTEGLSRQDPQPSTLNPQRFFSFTTAHGLPDKQVNQILEDDAGHLWIGCDEGIYRVAKRELAEVASGRAARVECLLLDEQDGLLGGQTHSGSQPSACKTPDGRLWFATPYGLAMVDPAHISTPDSQPKVFIERLRVGNASFEVLDAQFPKSEIRSQKRLLQNPRKDEFHESLISQNPKENGDSWNSSLRGRRVLKEPQKSEIAGGHSALGIGHSAIRNPQSAINWRFPAGSGRSLAFEFTALEYFAPKKLRFRYRLEGLDSDWVEAGVSRNAYYTNLKPGDYRFQVMAASRHGAWNEAGTAFAFHLAPFFWQTWWFHPAWLSALALAGLGLHRWRVWQIAVRQELERAAGLAQQRALLGADLHDAAGASLCQIVRQCEKVEAASGDTRFDAIATSAREALEAFDETVWLLKPGNDTLDRLALRIIRTADKLFEGSGVRARWQVPDNLPALPLKAAAQRDLLLMVKEFVHNVLKHARATQVRLQLSLTDGCLIIVIADDGCGFDLVQAPPDRHGLTSLRRRAEKWDGRLEIVSQPGSGTRVEVVVPLNVVAELNHESTPVNLNP